jgi:hypothetical protein
MNRNRYRLIVRCWCGARIINGVYCENGHMMNRVRHGLRR